MAQDPKPTRGMPRSLLYALIPGGFILMVVLMLIYGRTPDERDDPVPAAQQETVPVMPQVDDQGAQRPE